PTPPTNAGTYTVIASMANPNYDASNVTGTLVVHKAAATIALSNLGQVYDGLPKPVTATTSPAGLDGVSISYNGSPNAPSNAGSYSVVASLKHPNYEAHNTTDTLGINKASTTITLGNPGQIYDGSPKRATSTTVPA